MSLCDVLSQSVLSGAKLLKHLAHTKSLQTTLLLWQHILEDNGHHQDNP